MSLRKSEAEDTSARMWEDTIRKLKNKTISEILSFDSVKLVLNCDR